MDTQELQQVALFDKCRTFTKAREIQAAGLYPYFNPISESEDTVVVIDGQKRIMLGSNNYLGPHPSSQGARGGVPRPAPLRLGLHRQQVPQRHARPARAARERHRRIPRQGSLSRLLHRLLGQPRPHLRARRPGRDVYLDKLDHASIVDGAKLSYGDTERFNHGDLGQPRAPDGAERLRPRVDDRGRRRLLDGRQHRRRTRAGQGRPQVRHGAGPRRRARPRRARPERRRHRRALRHDRRGRHHRRHLLQVAGVDRRLRGGVRERHPLSQAPQPAADLHGVAATGQHRRRARRAAGAAARARAPRPALGQHPPSARGIPEPRASTSARPRRRSCRCSIGPLEKTFLMWRRLFDAGVFTNPVAPPAVPPSQCRLRTSLMATHTFEQIDFSLEQFARIGRDLGVI